MANKDYEKNLTCPYCDFEDEDSWEISPWEEDIGDIDCQSCWKTFLATRHIKYSYCSKIIK